MKSLTLTLLIVFMGASTAYAAPLDWNRDKYSHYSEQEPLKDILNVLATSQKTQIVISDKVDDVVSVHFKNKEPKAIFEELTKTYGLTWYFDGDVLYIYKKDEIETGTVSLEHITAEEFTRSLKELNILDEHFRWDIAGDGSIIYFKGPKQFIESVLTMANVMDKPQAKELHPTPPIVQQRSIYRWKDKNGITNFSTVKPRHLDDEDNDLKVISQYDSFTVLGQ